MKMGDYLVGQAKKLSEITEIDQKEILGVLQNRVKEGYSAQGAVMMWKSEHKQQLGAGEAREFVGRVIGNSGKKTVRDWEICNIGMLIYDDGILETRNLGFWNESIAKTEMFTMDHVFEFKAFEKQDGSLTRVRAVKEVEDDKVPKVTAVSEICKSLKDLKQLSGENHLLHGWVGKVIANKEGSKLGFEFGDDESLSPVTCWVSGRFRELPKILLEQLEQVEAGDEVFVYGFVRVDGKGNSVVDGNGIFKV